MMSGAVPGDALFRFYILFLLGFMSGLAGGQGSRFMNANNADATIGGIRVLQKLMSVSATAPGSKKGSWGLVASRSAEFMEGCLRITKPFLRYGTRLGLLAHDSEENTVWFAWLETIRVSLHLQHLATHLAHIEAIYWGYLSLRAEKLQLPFNSPEAVTAAHAPFVCRFPHWFTGRSWDALGPGACTLGLLGTCAGGDQQWVQHFFASHL